MSQFPVFYPIFNQVSWLERLAPLGIKLAQLRIKNQPQEIVRQELLKAKELSRHYKIELVVNDHWELALKTQCTFVHLGQEDLETADISALKRANIKFGLSTHNESELEKALYYKPNYIALGPIFPTHSKDLDSLPEGLKQLSQWKERLGKTPLIAIGGINFEQAKRVLSAGADAISVIADVTKNPNPTARVKQWLTL